MATDFWEILILPEPLNPPPPEPDAESGAVVEFYGIVRRKEGADDILGIDYEAFPEMALHQLAKVTKEALDRFGYRKLLLLHRTGFVPVGEASLFVRVTACHRHEAFEACEWVIDRLKDSVPIWKKPLLEGATLNTRI